MTVRTWQLDPLLPLWLPLALLAVGLLGLFGLAALGSVGLDRLTVNQARRILANSATPLVAQLVNRAVDLIFAAIALRILGVEGNGEYAIATVTWLYLKTITDFGLSILVAREVARAPQRAGHLVGTTTLFRWAVLVCLLPLLGALVTTGRGWLGLSPASLTAIVLLVISIIPASYSEAINSVFTGYERMHLPAILTIFTNLVRFAIGLVALGYGLGVPGIATAAVIAATCNAAAFHLAMHRLAMRVEWVCSLAEWRCLAKSAWPLLLNGLLITVFFRVDTFVIQAFEGTYGLGIYDAAYKLPNLVPLIPSYFVLAVFPLLSRQSGDDRRRSFELGAKFLVLTGWLIVLVTLIGAPLFIRILGGQAFLPEAAETLRILIWFTPLHFLNGIAQYAVIAADRQRAIAPAYIAATIFNLLGNLTGVPLFGYRAAAVVTVLTEIVLLLALRRALEESLGPIAWNGLLWRPLPAVLSASAMVWFALEYLPAAVVLVLPTYFVLLWMTGAVSIQDVALLRPLLPHRLVDRLRCYR